jgi:hypothetical protein
MDRIIKELKKEIGLPGLKDLLFDLSGPHSNWQVAKKYNTHITRITFLNDNIAILCRTVLEEMENEKINHFTTCPIYRIDESTRSQIRVRRISWNRIRTEHILRNQNQ